MFQSGEFIDRLRRMSTADVQRTYARCEAVERRFRTRRLLALAVLDERKVAASGGAADTEEWVAAESQLTRHHAQTEVRTARALAEQPAVATAAAAGRLSCDQLDPLTRFTTPHNHERWAREAPGWTPDQLAAHARRTQPVTTAEANERHDRRTLRWWNHDGGKALRGWLPDVDGSTFVKAIEREMEKAGAGADGSWAAHDHRAADALVALAGQRLRDDSDPNRALVVIHAPASALPAAAGEAPGCDVPDAEVALAAETVRRLTCDGTAQLLVESPDGQAIGIGRRSRTVPPWLHRLLVARDHHCRGPGCDRTRGLHAHHMVHWADGGRTDADNLVLLCPRCHRLVHERRWSVRGDPARPDGLEFRAPDTHDACARAGPDEDVAA